MKIKRLILLLPVLFAVLLPAPRGTAADSVPRSSPEEKSLCETSGHLLLRSGYLPPSCREPGHSGILTCQRCGEEISKGRYLPAYCSASGFADVSTEAWYHEAVDFAVNGDLMNGLSLCSFDPGGATSRAMVVSVLYRLEGSPEHDPSSDFRDVLPGAWYAKAVAWAESTELVMGYGDGTFGPEDVVSRQQLVTLLYRYARYKGFDLALQGDLSRYRDREDVEGYALTAFSWAVANEIVNGLPDDRLGPRESAGRAQLAAILMRLRNWAGELLELPYSELTPQSPTALVNGQAIPLYRSHGVTMARAEDFAAAAGLNVVTHWPLKLSGRNDVAILEEDGLTVNGVTSSCPAPVYLDSEVYFPLMEVSEALSYPMAQLSDLSALCITPAAKRFVISAQVNVPVLMYHAVSDDLWGIDELFVSPSSLEEQLAYLVNNGYDPIWFEDLVHADRYDKPVILTFDDGYDDNYDNLFPLLKKYHVKATVFVIGNAVGTNHKATAEQLREMSDSGLVSVQSHTYTHEYLDTLSEAQLQREMAESKRVITEITGRIPYVVCYPTGRYNDLALQAAREYYNFGIKMKGGLYRTSMDPFLVNRYYISRYTSLATFRSYVAPAG